MVGLGNFAKVHHGKGRLDGGQQADALAPDLESAKRRKKEICVRLGLGDEIDEAADKLDVLGRLHLWDDDGVHLFRAKDDIQIVVLKAGSDGIDSDGALGIAKG